MGTGLSRRQSITPQPFPPETCSSSATSQRARLRATNHLPRGAQGAGVHLASSPHHQTCSSCGDHNCPAGGDPRLYRGPNRCRGEGAESGPESGELSCVPSVRGKALHQPRRTSPENLPSGERPSGCINARRFLVRRARLLAFAEKHARKTSYRSRGPQAPPNDFS